MRRTFVAVAAVLLAPVTVWAEGLHHATEFVLRRDGAWIVNFLLLFAGLYWVGVRFIIPALKKRSAELAELLDKTEKARAEAQSRLQELEAKVREFEAEAARLKQEAAEQGEKMKREVLAEADHMSKRIVEQAQAEIATEYARARNQLKKESVEMAMVLATGMLEKQYTETDNRKAVNEFLNKVGSQK